MVHPNPFNSIINIYIGKRNSDITIYDIKGRVVKTMKRLPDRDLYRWIPDKNVPAGTYTINVGGDKVKVYYIK